MKPVEIYWLDCYGDSSLKYNADEIKSNPKKFICKRKAIGYLAHSDKLYYYLAEDITIEFDCDDVKSGKKLQGLTAIPRGCVVKKKYLK